LKVYFYKLKFQGASHFGDTGIDLENVSEWVNSDTLFSALINAYSTIYGKDSVSVIIEDFKKEPPFLVSSLFLYYGKNFFLPRPMMDEHISKDLKREMGKELKTLKWLNVDGFLKWVNGKDIEKIDIEKMQLALKEYKQAFITEIRPRVSLDRVTQQSSIYNVGYVYFKEDAGLYGLVSFKNMAYLKEFEIMLKALGEIGLGGERAYGCGMFELISFQEIEGPLEKIVYNNSDIYVLLSLYHPLDAEFNNISDKLVAYDITRKQGWITTGRYALPLKRQSVGFFTEGSIIKGQIPKGTLIDVTPLNPPYELSHRIYRYGYAFTSPLRSIK